MLLLKGLSGSGRLPFNYCWHVNTKGVDDNQKLLK